MTNRPPEPPPSHASFRGVRLAMPDAAAGWRLSTEACWNQTEADWRFLLSVGTGFGFAAADGTLAASVVVLPYAGAFAWIGMVLVTASARRHGLATALTRRALEWCGEQRLVPLLDATPAGQAVYLSLGFREIRRLTRWQGNNPERGAPEADLESRVRRLMPGDLDRVVAWDTRSFGADRGFVLRHLSTLRPDLAFWRVADDGEPRGFCLGRPGRTATQIGPLVAETEAEARALLGAALRRVPGPVLLDLTAGWPALEQDLTARGLRPQREFARLVCGPCGAFGRPGCIHAIAGPELG